jgi:predicted nucleic acid-binding protein
LKTEALLDSNVIVAMVVPSHQHNPPSLALMGGADHRFAICAHSYAEAYNILTRKGDRAPFAFTPEQAWVALESLREATDLVGLTAVQTFDAVRQYAQDGGIGARLYDKLIGEAAVIHGINTILTWNVPHMHGLFPRLHVETPAEFIARSV